ncbi:Protein-serine/threonine phosphatase [Heracleum sosnowskyi]|uniref:protein-serine/threonine phosphatase n=1 Tax=Heracleum sosnowskyi TaxID=360622 RepID=A0AAD8II75_9APIA|nr:Protein-serine/threonine phosphatase [Heracleum sosnowskyi]
MGAEAEVMVQQNIIATGGVLNVEYRSRSTGNLDDLNGLLAVSNPGFIHDPISPSGSLTSLSPPVMKSPEAEIMQYFPSIRSGGFADIGPRRYMEDQHIKIDDLSMYLGSDVIFPKPNAFYGVFDGHGGPEAAAYVRKNINRFFFEDVNFPQSPEVDEAFLEAVGSSLRKSFLLADAALADDCSVSTSSGTTALAAIVLGSRLLVANAGDCRAVLCRKGEAIDMSQDHRPITRALGDWDLKLSRGSPSPLIAEPDVRQIVLTKDDEFLIIACDGIWDVMSSQQAISLVRRGLRRHDDPGQCARDLVMEALRLNTFDNLTVIIVCFTSLDHRETSPTPQRRLKCCSLSAEALCSLRNLLDGSVNHIHLQGCVCVHS